MLTSSKISYYWDEPEPRRHGGTLTVQEDHERPGHVMQMSLHWNVGSSVTPEVVREIIRVMVKFGWKPESPKLQEFGTRPHGRGQQLWGRVIDIEKIVTKMSVIKEVHDS